MASIEPQLPPYAYKHDGFESQYALHYWSDLRSGPDCYHWRSDVDISDVRMGEDLPMPATTVPSLSL